MAISLEAFLNELPKSARNAISMTSAAVKELDENKRYPEMLSQALKDRPKEFGEDLATASGLGSTNFGKVFAENYKLLQAHHEKAAPAVRKEILSKGPGLFSHRGAQEAASQAQQPDNMIKPK